MKRIPHNRAILALGLAAMLLLSGCKALTKKAAPESTAAVPVAEGDFAKGSNAALSFALLYAGDKSGDTLVNTAGLTAVLAAIKNGTREQTDEALTQAMGAQDLSIKAINERAAALHGALGGLKNGRFASAWGLFVGENQAVKQKYLDDCERELALPSTFKQLDKDTGNTFLGSWADDNTGGRIKSVNFTIPGGSAPFFVDLNTADPDWQEAMDPTRTRALPFHPESGDGNPVPMLNCVMNCGVHTGSEGSLAVLPFAGDETRLVVMLPPEGTGVHDFLPVAAAHHDEWLKDAVWKEQRVLLPRVTLAAEGSVKPVLAGAGFDVLSSGANHDGMGNGLGLADVLQKTELVVDESGQQDTGNTADYNPDQPDDIPTFTVDRPYVLLLEDGKTGAILMAAVVRDPLSGGTSAK